jgi:hypothetical protein
MSRNAIPTTFQNLNTQALQDPRVLEQYTQRQFGMSSAKMQLALDTLMAVSQGRIPEPAGMKFVIESAREKYGWSETRTRAELRTVLASGSPQERIHNYLTGNGASQTDPAMFNFATDLVQNGLRADLELGIQSRLNQPNSNNAPERRYEGMEAHKRTIEDSKDKANLRATLETLSGHNKPQSYEAKVHNVIRARHQLADRIDVQSRQQAAGHEPSLKESLSSAFDEAVVSQPVRTWVWATLCKKPVKKSKTPRHTWLKTSTLQKTFNRRKL